MIAIINYGVGNLHSVRKAVEYVGGKSILADDPGTLSHADKVILPGVGAFRDGMLGLETRDLIAPLQDAVHSGKLILGICLGMQLMFDLSEEQGLHQGLGLIPGRVMLFKTPGIKVPQIGWNQVTIQKDSALFRGITDGDYFYFNHSYYCAPENLEDAAAITDYGLSFVSSVENENLFGVQFHPEKSQRLGLTILKNFVEK